ncbi:hypothetical protein SAMN04487895_101772 [Paenibacillus sophorae]|uniref:Uncharacterized protein n=1 Tax=Paenibacillus sophorae TaxID=1333845 RepID=A0A1H8H786_9BACL|nr:hypothetical protein [Paenibacillus sophorae]QWU14462.1 hypothetical protein KP014_21375 [Paenibacillus sophorae]SEN51869.1 hypothetical protein SAMN04487895_101772 [Paenibacillus sophorae]
MILGNSQYRYSPVKEAQNFVWVADYMDGTYLSEYNLDDRIKNDYYQIDKHKLIRFGLIGMGSQIYFDVANGIFNVNKNRIQVSYVANGVEYPLTGRAFLYNDITQYKRAWGDGKLLSKTASGRIRNNIIEHVIGYKKAMDLANVNINFKNLLHIPQNKNTPPFLEIKISVDKELDGELIFRVNGLIANKLHAPLLKNRAGVYNWELI